MLFGGILVFRYFLFFDLILFHPQMMAISLLVVFSNFSDDKVELIDDHQVPERR
jgi:hypothetical protein